MALIVPPRFRKRIGLIAIVSIAIMIFVAICHSSKWRDARFAEAFFEDSAVTAYNQTLQATVTTEDKARHEKNDDYASYLKPFYSDKTGVTNKTVFFNPSVNDVVCQYGSADSKAANCRPNRSSIDLLSVRDNTTMVPAILDCTRDVPDITARGPIDPTDAQVRILNGVYVMSKVCLTLSLSINDVTNQRLTLRSDSQGTRLFMLLRPLFIAIPGSRLYSVNYDYTTAGQTSAGNSNVDYNSQVSGLTTVGIEEVRNQRVYPTGEKDVRSNTVDLVRAFKALTGRTDLQQNWEITKTMSVTTGAVSVMMTLYFLNFRALMPDFRFMIDPQTAATSSSTNTAARYNAATLVLSVPPVAGARSVYSVTPQTFTFTVSRGVSESGKSRYSVQTVSGSNASQNIEGEPGGFVVITYTTNLLIMASISTQGIRLRHFPGQQVLSLTAGQIQSMREAMVLENSARLQMDSIFPYNDVACVPNFADLAIKLVGTVGGPLV